MSERNSRQSNADPEILDRIWDEIALEMCVLLRSVGKSPEEFARSLDRHYPTAETTLRPRTESGLIHSILPQAISLWHSLPDYIDSTGDPLPIKIHGAKPSLEHLMHNAKRAAKLNDNSTDPTLASEMLIGANSAQLRPSGELELINDVYVYIHDKDVYPEVVLRHVAGFMGTIARNLQTDRRPAFQRLAWSACFPKKNLGLLKRVADDQGMEFMRQMDSLLMDSEDTEGEDQTYAAVGMYITYRDD